MIPEPAEGAIRGSIDEVEGERAVDAERGIAAALWLIVIGTLACGLIAGISWIMARAAVYTVTNRRVVLRIGAALTLAMNLKKYMIGLSF